MGKRVIISFDYELFFGDEPGTVQKSLLEPTAKLMDAMEYAGAKATFFVDYLMLKYMLIENDITKAEAQLIIEQLKEMLRRGHRIELHLHPHWVDAKYINGKWDFTDFTHYCLNSFPKDEITQMFVEGTEFLEKIAKGVIPNYKVIAFRAGGWAILPFEIIREGFQKAGIKVDSSVMQGRVVYANDMILDFSKAPRKSLYLYEANVLEEKPNGSFIEAQICSFQHNIITTLLAIYYSKKHPELYKRLTDGSHKRKNEKPLPQPPKTRWQLLHRRQVLSLSGLPSFLLNYEIRTHKSPLVILISHPKDIMPITCFNIRRFRGNDFEFCSYKDLIQ